MGDNLIVETKRYNLSTRSSGCRILNEDPNYKSLCEYNIPNMIERDETIEYIHFSIPTIVIPVSFYSINENNCTLDVIENGITSSYSFPYGNYSANYFIQQFTILLGTQWSITLSGYNSVFTITNSLHSFTLLESSTIDSVIGFNTTLVSSGTGPYSITLSRCCNFLPLPRINMCCAELANCTTIGAVTSSDIILSVPNNAKPNGQIYYINFNNSRLLFRHHEITRFVISFEDDDGNLINFNGVSCFFTLQFDIYRKYMPKPPAFGNLVEYVNQNSGFMYSKEEPLDGNI